MKRCFYCKDKNECMNTAKDIYWSLRQEHPTLPIKMDFTNISLSLYDYEVLFIPEDERQLFRKDPLKTKEEVNRFFFQGCWGNVKSSDNICLTFGE